MACLEGPQPKRDFAKVIYLLGKFGHDRFRLFNHIANQHFIKIVYVLGRSKNGILAMVSPITHIYGISIRPRMNMNI